MGSRSIRASNSDCAANTKIYLKVDSHSGKMSPYAVITNDLVVEVRIRAQVFERKLSNAIDPVNNLESSISKLQPQSHLAGLEPRLVEYCSVASGNFLDVLAFITSSKMDGWCIVIFFNVPHRSPITSPGDQLLTTSDMAKMSCLMTRLRKRTQRYSYFNMHLQVKTSAHLFISRRNNNAGTALLKNKIKKESTSPGINRCLHFPLP